MNSTITSEVWVDDVLRRWKIASAYFIEAYLITTLYLLYGTNIREWDLLQFFSSTVVLLRVPLRELFGVIDCTVASLCCRLMDRVFGPNWAVQLPFSVPTWLRKVGSVKGSKGIDWGWFSLNTMSSVILTDFVLSSYLMDQSWERMLSSASLVIVWIVIDDQPLLSSSSGSSSKARLASGWCWGLNKLSSLFTAASPIASDSTSAATAGASASAGGFKSHPHTHTQSQSSIGPTDSGSINVSSRSPSFSSLALPTGRGNPLLSLVYDAFDDGAALAFVTCVAPKLAATPIAPLHSYVAGHCMSVFAMMVLSLLCAVEKIVSERLTLTLSMAAISCSSAHDDHAEAERSRDGGGDGGPEVRQVALTSPSSDSSAYTRALAYISLYYPSFSFISGITAEALRADEGCCTLRDSPFISLLLSAATALLLLQAAVLSIIEPRRRLGFILLTCCGLAFVSYIKKVLSQR